MTPNKRNNEPRDNQATGFREADPATIVLRDGDTIEAKHHFIAANGYVAAYTGDRQAGIDYRVPESFVAYIDTSDEDIRSGNQYSRSDGTHRTMITSGALPPTWGDE